MGRFLWSVGGWMLAFLVGGGLWLDLQGAKRDLREAQQSQAKWQARYAEASTSVKTQTVTVTKWATRYDTLRARITDTVAVPTSGTSVPDWGTVLEAADSTIAACRDLVSSCEQFRIVADSTIVATRREATAYKNLYHATRPSWKTRFGISCGYSVSKIGADFKAGPSCQVGVRVFP